MAKRAVSSKKKKEPKKKRIRGDEMARVFHVEQKTNKDLIPVPEIVDKSKMGAPSDYNPEYCQRLIDHMASGLSFDSSAAIFDVSRATIYNWTEAHADFLDAKKKGEQKNLLFWEMMGVNGAFGKLKGFNAIAFIFNMKNRHKWKDRHDLNLKGQGSMGGTNSSVVITIPSNGREVKVPEAAIDAEFKETTGEDPNANG